MRSFLDLVGFSTFNHYKELLWHYLLAVETPTASLSLLIFLIAVDDTYYIHCIIIVLILFGLVLVIIGENIDISNALTSHHNIINTWTRLRSWWSKHCRVREAWWHWGSYRSGSTSGAVATKIVPIVLWADRGRC